MAISRTTGCCEITVSAKREITIHDLLTHTSGIDYALIGSDKMRAIYAKAGLHPFFGDDTMQLKNAVATLPLARIGGVDAFFRIHCAKVQVGRIDPIVNPGALAAHCHTIVGGSSEFL